MNIQSHIKIQYGAVTNRTNACNLLFLCSCQVFALNMLSHPSTEKEGESENTIFASESLNKSYSTAFPLQGPAILSKSLCILDSLATLPTHRSYFAWFDC